MTTKGTVFPVTATTSKPEETVPARLARAADKLERARVLLIDAAKALDSDLIPNELHRDVLFAMDAARDNLVALADFNARLAEGQHGEVLTTVEMECERRLGLIEQAERAVREADDGSIGMGDVKRAMSRALRDAQVDLAELLVPSGGQR